MDEFTYRKTFAKFIVHSIVIPYLARHELVRAKVGNGGIQLFNLANFG